MDLINPQHAEAGSDDSQPAHERRAMSFTPYPPAHPLWSASSPAYAILKTRLVLYLLWLIPFRRQYPQPPPLNVP